MNIDVNTWEAIGIVGSVIGGTITAVLKINKIENEYQAGKNKQQELEKQLLRAVKDLEIQQKEVGRLKAQVGREFNNIAWQLRIIIGSLKDIENFLEQSSNYTRRKSTEISDEEDTRGFMLKKIKELDLPED